MAEIIPSEQKFHTLDKDTPTKDRGSKQAQALRKIYTMADISATAAVAAGAQELSISGSELSISNGNTVDLGDQEIKLIPFPLTAGAGGSSIMSSDYNLIDISWDGLGNGTYTLNLPTAASMIYRNVRVITDGTLAVGAADKINITPAGSETINGSASFQISKRYEGVSMWSSGTEWIIIQAKAH
tara:strand:+ start:129 stop:683 length:555 start_codon:yes stop_codon:yes gene_type:complete